MNIKIKATNFELTPSIEEYVIKKIGHIEHYLERFKSENNTGKDNIEAIIEVAKTTKHHNKGDLFLAEANLIVKGKQIRVEETSDNLMTSIDKLADVLKEQAIKFKEKHSEYSE